MKPQAAMALLLVFPAAAFLHAKDKKPNVPAVFGQAQYVYVEAIDGSQFDPNLYPEDREAIADVQDALSNWHRYVLTMEREHADLIIVVRKGRAASANVGVSPRSGVPNSGSIGIGQQGPGQGRAGTSAGNPGGAGPRATSPGATSSGAADPGAPGPGIAMGTEVGPSEDFFEVCQFTGDGKLTTPLWERQMPDGLDAPRVLLFQQFREAVDKAYPMQPAQQPKKP